MLVLLQREMVPSRRTFRSMAVFSIATDLLSEGAPSEARKRRYMRSIHRSILGSRQTSRNLFKLIFLSHMRAHSLTGSSMTAILTGNA